MSQMALSADGVRRVERIQELMHEQERLLREQDEWPNAVAIATGIPPSTVNTDLAGRNVTSAVELLWRHNGRVAFTMHPDLMTEIDDAILKKVPGEVFTKLPYINPLVVFAEPIAVTAGDESFRILGVYTYGTTGPPGDIDRRLCLTPESHHLGILVISEVLNVHGGVVDCEFTRLSVPTTGRYTADEAAEAAAEYYHTEGTTSKAWIATVIKNVLPALIYLCSREPDLQEVRQRSGKGRSNRKPKQLIKVGWRQGPELQANRRRAEQHLTTTGATVTPHQRRGHFQGYWVGTGDDKELVVRYKQPKWVNEHLLNENTPSAIIPVRQTGELMEECPHEDQRHIDGLVICYDCGKLLSQED